MNEEILGVNFTDSMSNVIVLHFFLVQFLSNF